LRLAIGLATAMIAVVMVGILLNGQGEVLTSPLEVAVAYVEGAAHDVDAAAELLAPDVIIEETGGFEWGRAYGLVVQNQGCEETSTGPDGTTVECSILVLAETAQALGARARNRHVHDHRRRRSDSFRGTKLRR
jgi:hypothetical protein